MNAKDTYVLATEYMKLRGGRCLFDAQNAIDCTQDKETLSTKEGAKECARYKSRFRLCLINEFCGEEAMRARRCIQKVKSSGNGADVNDSCRDEKEQVERCMVPRVDALMRKM